MKKHPYWPPSEWDEADLFRDDETRLPTCLYPFFIQRDIEHGTGWRLFEFVNTNRGDRILEEGLPNIFEAFRRMLDAYEAWYPTRPEPKVYFIGTELKVGVPVKIGTSVNPRNRLSSIQTGHPEKLQIFALAGGDRFLERKYHGRWKHRRINGEWFTLGDCIIKEIKRLQQIS